MTFSDPSSKPPPPTLQQQEMERDASQPAAVNARGYIARKSVVGLGRMLTAVVFFGGGAAISTLHCDAL